MTKLSALIFSTVLFSGLTHACTKPEAPVLPDTVSEATDGINEAKNEVNAYIAAAEAYLECASRDKDPSMVKSMKRDVGESKTEISS